MLHCQRPFLVGHYIVFQALSENSVVGRKANVLSPDKDGEAGDTVISSMRPDAGGQTTSRSKPNRVSRQSLDCIVLGCDLHVKFAKGEAGSRPIWSVILRSFYWRISSTIPSTRSEATQDALTGIEFDGNRRRHLARDRLSDRKMEMGNLGITGIT